MVLLRSRIKADFDSAIILEKSFGLQIECRSYNPVVLKYKKPASTSEVRRVFLMFKKKYYSFSFLKIVHCSNEDRTMASIAPIKFSHK